MPTIFTMAMHLNSRTILLVALLAVGFWLRIAPVFHNQIYFWFDQGLDTILVKQLVVDHRLSLVGRYSGLAGLLMGPLWTWILSVPFVLGRGAPAANVVFFSFLGILSSWATFSFLMRRVNLATATILLILTLFAPIYIYSSQVVASPHPLAFLMIFFIWSLYELLSYKRTFFWLPLGLLVGVFFQLEIGFAVFTLPAVLVAVVFFKAGRLLATREFILGVLIFLLTFLPQVLFDWRHDFLISQSLGHLFLGGGNNLYGRVDPLWLRFGERAKSMWSDFVAMALYIKPMLWRIPVLALSLGGWVLILTEKRKVETDLLKILLVVLVTFYLGFSLYPGPLWNWYRAGLPLVYFLLLAIPWGGWWYRGLFWKLVVALFVVVFVASGIDRSGFYGFIKGERIDDNAILQNQLAAVDYVYNRAGGQPFSYFAYTPPVYDYIWAYDFWWYGQKKYGYLPKNWQMGVPLLGRGGEPGPPKVDEGLFFLIMEPDKERPWQVDGWKKTYIKIGKAVNEKKFPGGILVEQRVTDELIY